MTQLLVRSGQVVLPTGTVKADVLVEGRKADGVTLRLARVKPQVLAVLRADGIVDRIGADHIHGNVHRAVEAQLAGDQP